MSTTINCPHCMSVISLTGQASSATVSCPQCHAVIRVADDRVSRTSEQWHSNPGGARLEPSANEFAEPESIDPVAADHEHRIRESNAANPYQSPLMHGETASGDRDLGAENEQRQGLPWENRGNVIRSFFSTMWMLLIRPLSAFRMMYVRRFLGTAYLFNLSFVTLGAFVTFSLEFLYWTFLNAWHADQPHSLDFIMIASFWQAFQVFFWPLFTPFINAAVCHVALRIVGAGKHGYSTTAKAALYLSGLSTIIVVPLTLLASMGEPLVYLIWLFPVVSFGYWVAGMSGSQGIGVGRAFGATVLAIVGSIALTVAIVVGLVAACLVVVTGLS